MKNKFKKGMLFLLPLGLGGITSLFVDNKLYEKIILPEYAPPKILFPIVWSLLYLMMGYVLIRIIKSNNKVNILLFCLQLFLNYLWVFLFFTFKLYFISFLDIIFLDIVLFYLILNLKKYDKKCFYLMIPYLVWTCFASYLNWAIFLLN